MRKCNSVDSQMSMRKVDEAVVAKGRYVDTAIVFRTRIFGILWGSLLLTVASSTCCQKNNLFERARSRIETGSGLFSAMIYFSTIGIYRCRTPLVTDLCHSIRSVLLCAIYRLFAWLFRKIEEKYSFIIVMHSRI